MSCARREADPSEPAGTGTRAPSPRCRNLFSFSLFSPPLAAVRPRGLSAVPAALSSLALGALLLLAAAPAAAQTVAADRAALVALYNATGGANWTNNTNWLSNEALSEWHGVSTDANGRVTQLSLSRNGLSGEIPVELGNLTSLQYLYLWGNGLSGEIPVELGNMTSLQELSLSRNGLSGEIPVELGNLTNLQILYLNQNMLSGEIPAELGNLTSLQELYLWGNGLSGEIPVELGNMTSLQELSLSQNGLSGEIPGEMGNLTNLQILYLNQNMLSGEIPAELGNMTSLQILYLWGNGLSGEIPAELGNMTSLRELSLSQNGLSGEIPGEMGNLTNLQILHLWGNGLSGEIPVELKNLTNLQELSLNHNMLSGEIPAELGNLTSLQLLALNQNMLSGEIPAELGNLTSLQILYLNQNMLSGEIPGEMGNLTSLQELFLHENGLSGEIPAELGNMTSLQLLALNQNMLSGEIPAELGNMTSLQILYLFQNELSGEIPAELGNMTSLQILYLLQNMLSGPLPLTLSTLSQLSVLDIRLTNLCAPVDPAFLAWLETIEFQGTVCFGPPTPPTVTLELMPTSIDENGGSTTVTARLDRESSETTTVTVSATAVSPAVAGDFRLSSNRTLTITAGQTTSTGTVTITANDNDVDTPGNTVRVSGTASNRLGVTSPADVTLTITDDDDPPTVMLRLSRTSIGENGGSATVTARLDRASSETTTVTVSATAVSPAVAGDFSLSANKTLTITAGQTTSTGTVTITANDNDADTPDNTVRVSGTADNSHGVTDPDDEELTITDDDDPPTVMLRLSRTSIGENGGSATVTARLDRASSAVTAVTVSAMAVNPAVSDDFMLSTNKTLTIAAGRTDSAGTVTVRAVDNNVDATNKEVRVAAAADNSHGVAGNPSPVTLRITDDDDAPQLTLAVRPSAIAEDGGVSTVTVESVNGVAFAQDQQIALAFAGTAAKGTDYTVALERLTLTAGQSSVDTTVTAVDDAVDDDAETILVTARHGGGVLGAEQTITITDDDASPVIITASPILVEENATAVATLTATDADRPAEDLTWRITGGADRSRFRLTSDGVLTFAAPQDYEAPGDSDGNGDYEVTVEVSDGFNPVEAVFTIRLEDVDDTAPMLSSASVNGATLTLTYGETLDPNPRPGTGDFTVSGGNSARTVSDVAVSGRAVTLTLNPAVEHGETGIRVSYRPGANPIQDAAGNDALGLSNQPVTNNTGDTTAPAVSRVEITSRPERNATYAAEEEIEVTVTFSETVVVAGTPGLMLNVGGVNRTASFRSGTGAALRFAYAVADGESDGDGVSIEADSLTGTIRDGANNNALLTHDGLAADARHKVDGVKPALVANGGAVVNGATLTLTYGEALDGGSTPLTAAFTIIVEGAERRVSRVAVSGSAVTLTLEPEVGVGQGVRLTYRVPGANPIQNAVGNDARPLANLGVENNTRDTTAPRVSRVAITSNPGPDGTYAEEDVIEVTVTFSETVQVDTTNGTPVLALTVGRSKPARYIPGPASVAQRFTYMVADGDLDTDGVSIAAGRIALNDGTIQDLADNPSILAYEAVPPQPSHAVDGVRPELQGATVNGATLTLTYNEALDEDSTPSGGDFTVNVADVERPLTEVLVSGRTVTLTLVSEVTPGQTVTVSYTPGTRPIQDAAGNAAEDLTEYTVGSPPPPPPPPPPPITGGGGGGGGGSGGRGRPPSYPGTIRAESGDGAVTLRWNAPSSQGSSRILYYEYRIDGEGEWISTGSTDRTHTITGLINGRTYIFHLRAVSAAGAGAHRISPEATPVADLDFTHFANGGFITSTLVLVNAGAYPVRPAIYFYDQDGDPIAARRVVELTPDLEVGDDGALSPRTVMSPLEELTIATHGRGGLRVGSVTVRAPGSIGGVLRFDIPGYGVAGVGDSPTLRDALVPVRRQDGGINTGVAVRNRGTAALTLQCRLMRDGAVLEEADIRLQVNGQDSRFIDQVFPTADTSDFAGSVRCAAPEPGRFSAVAFELDGTNRIFTTLPVVPVPAVPEQEQEQQEEQDQEQEEEQDATRLDFTHFANGGNIVSSLVLVNAGANPVRPAIYFHDQDGGAIAAESLVEITEDLEVGDDGALRPGAAINPLGELTISTHGRGVLKVGSVAVVADGPIGGVLRFDIPGLGVAGVGDSPPVRDALVPVRRQDGGINTGVAIHNRGTTALLVRCRLMRDGIVLDETMIPLAANGQDSRFIDQVFPTADTSDFVGSVRCLTPEPGLFSAVAFELDGVNRVFTTLPVVPVVDVP